MGSSSTHEVVSHAWHERKPETLNKIQSRIVKGNRRRAPTGSPSRFFSGFFILFDQPIFEWFEVFTNGRRVHAVLARNGAHGFRPRPRASHRQHGREFSSGVLTLVNVAAVEGQRRIDRIVLARLQTQGSVELELDDGADEIPTQRQPNRYAKTKRTAEH